MSNEPKFWPIDALNAYPEPVGTLDKLELLDGAVWVHLNGRRAKLVGLQSLAFLIGNLKEIHAESYGYNLPEPSAPDAIDPRECRKCGSLTADKCKAGGCWFEREPSAPVERDERGKFESVYDPEGANLDRKSDGDYENPYVESAWEGWQARAALERKPSCWRCNQPL